MLKLVVHIVTTRQWGLKRNTMGSCVFDWYAKGWVPEAGCCERGDEPSNRHVMSGVI
jgi:hypothetical protein